MKQFAPKILKDGDGKEYILVKERLYGTHRFCYAFKDNPRCRMILNPRQIEKEFIRDKPEPQGVVTQAYYECAIASVAMATNRTPDEVRSAFLSVGWVKENGVSFFQMKKGLRALGFRSMFHKTFPQIPCLVSAPSINVPRMGHSLYFDGKVLKDPQTYNSEYLWYGPDWSPEAIGTGFMTLEPIQEQRAHQL